LPEQLIEHIDGDNDIIAAMVIAGQIKTLDSYSALFVMFIS